jgi:hypothetical protein
MPNDSTTATPAELPRTGPGRRDRIYADWARAEASGLGEIVYCYSPGDRHGRRWVCNFMADGYGRVDRTLSTREAEALGALLARGKTPAYPPKFPYLEA